MTITLTGGCHCGAVRFAVDLPSAVVEVLDCNCTMCSKTGFLHLIVEAAQFRLLQGEAALREYRFGTGTARHLFCGACGIKSYYVPRSHPDGFSVNLRALDDASVLATTITPYDGRGDWEQARARLG